mmetsp:Transcript_7962/g.14419  ORF Transcript_7962/g.14419 Transcript_7962/m.14419 type:complete len:100 (-) Transcript_7962:1495-1794(-)
MDDGLGSGIKSEPTASVPQGAASGGVDSVGAAEKKRAGTGDFERQVEEIRREAALVRENLAAAERALAEAAAMRGNAPHHQRVPHQTMPHNTDSPAPPS